MKKIFYAILILMTMSGCNNNPATKTGSLGEATVYLTREISPESLVNIYKALGVPAQGRVAIKMSTGEGSNPNYLKPELVKDLFFEVDGTVIAPVPGKEKAKEFAKAFSVSQQIMTKEEYERHFGRKLVW